MRWIPAVAMALVLIGCSSTRQTVAGWFGEAPPTPTAVAAQPGQVYYAAVDGLTVYAQASNSSKVVGHLTMHERVTRSRIEHGYAYVTSSGNLEGWVDNAQLIWRLPAAASQSEPPRTGAPAGGGAAAAADTTGAESVPAAPPTPTPTSTPGPGTAPPTIPPTQPSQPPTPKRAEPSLFDPY